MHRSSKWLSTVSDRLRREGEKGHTSPKHCPAEHVGAIGRTADPESSPCPKYPPPRTSACSGLGFWLKHKQTLRTGDGGPSLSSVTPYDGMGPRAMCLGFLLGLGHCLQPMRCPAHLLPSWKRANSRAARSNTVSDVTVTGPLALLGNMPCTRTSCQSEWSLQISTESKYLWGSQAQPWRGPLQVCCSTPTPARCSPHSHHQQVTHTPLGRPGPACPVLESQNCLRWK